MQVGKICFWALCLFYGLLFLPSCSKDGDEDVLPPDSGIQEGSGSQSQEEDGEGGGHSQFEKDLLLGTWGLIHSVSDEWKTVITFNGDGTYTASDYYIDMNGEYTELEGTTEGQYEFDGVSLSIKLGSGDGTLLIGDYEVLVLTQSELRIESENYEAHGTKESGTGEGCENGNRGPVSEAFMGNGTKTDPYLIVTAADLRKLSDDVRNGATFRDEHFRLANDIVINQNVLTSEGDLNGDGSNFEQWIPIGTENTPFCGTLDGNGYSIKGIYINEDAEEHQKLGLFGFCDGNISNLDLRDSFIRGYGNIGGFVGKADIKLFFDPKGSYKASLFNCRNYATIESPHKGGFIGGCVGRTDCCVIDHCANYGIVRGIGIAPTQSTMVGLIGGGIVGDMSGSGSYVVNCYNEGYVNAINAGGITGRLSFGADMINCYNNGCVEGFSQAGGLSILFNENAIIKNCVNYGEIWTEDEKGYAVCPNITGGSKLSFVYHLETTGITDVWSNSMTAKQMKATSFMDKLNDNARNIVDSKNQWTCDRWIMGKDGFPVLEWSEEL